MDEQQARALLKADRERVVSLLKNEAGAAKEATMAARETGDYADRAEPLTGLEIDQAVSAALKERLAAIERAEKRLDAGTYGNSVLSGQPIPDERLEADPAAELTVEEARRHRP
ncbi:MAG: hypothetical protein NVS1B16_13590 [Pseudarthrobacter sp.]